MIPPPLPLRLRIWEIGVSYSVKAKGEKGRKKSVAGPQLSVLCALCQKSKAINANLYGTGLRGKRVYYFGRRE